MVKDYFFDLESENEELQMNSDCSSDNYLVTNEENEINDTDLAEIKAELERLDKLREGMQ